MACTKTFDGTIESAQEPDPGSFADIARSAEVDGSALAGLSRSEVGAIGERAAARFLTEQFGHEELRADEHHVNAPGVDHLLISTGQMLVVAETKSTGISASTSKLNAEGKIQDVKPLLSQRQKDLGTFMEGDRNLKGSGLDSSMVAEKLVCRVDVLSQSVDVWEQGPDGRCDLVGTFECRTTDLVDAAVESAFGGDGVDA